MKLFHAADIHLDSPLRGLDKKEGAPVERLRRATRGALENLVAACIDEEVVGLVIAGDLFDGAWKDAGTGLFFAGAMARLKDAGIPVLVVRGNHDAESTVVRRLPAPSNVHTFSSRKVERFELADGALVLHGTSFATKAVTDDLAARFPEADSGAVHVGVLHTSLDGREGHEPYAPTTLDVLRSRGYAYWALGHVHAREIVSRDPWVVFPGNLQGRHAREVGEKGASLVTFSDRGVVSVEHRVLDVVRWAHVTVDASGCDARADVMERARAALEDEVQRAEGRLLAARVRFEGTCPVSGALHDARAELADELRLVAVDVAGEDAWIEKLEIATRTTVDVLALRAQDTALGQLARRIEEVRGDDAALLELGGCLEDLRKKLPPEVRNGPEGFDPSDLGVIRELYTHVEESLLGALTEAKGRD